jgi:hypothetical protein
MLMLQIQHTRTLTSTRLLIRKIVVSDRPVSTLAVAAAKFCHHVNMVQVWCILSWEEFLKEKLQATKGIPT